MSRTAGEFLVQCENCIAVITMHCLGPNDALSDLEISGFSRDNGPFMVCKEFLDNAVDACAKSVSPLLPPLDCENVELEVSIRTTSLLVTCRDTGKGIDCATVSALGEVFCSSKAQDPQTGGEFGIGLKAIMLSSQRDLKQPVNVKIRMRECEVWSFGISLDAASVAPLIQNFAVEALPASMWPWMTEFSVELSPIWDMEKEKEIEAYAAIHSIWSPEMSLKLTIKTKLVFRGNNTFRNPRGPDGTFLSIAEGQEPLAVATASASCDGAKLELTAAVLSANATGDDEGSEIHLVRSFNGTPLLPSAASSCLLTKCLRYCAFVFFKPNFVHVWQLSTADAI
ncbi:uncharacterized protein LOC113147272 [Cyclospora cayetanensis]|uniref:Uncharacterized protein LOC113147272 n=1 Tax=Cyclospora cayetanensis TaxID=88456 RepID=A0A6P6RYS3_9EIME|nr:uncharacterized protein LOC113147272 [Cyclospora cayetanensis]